VVTALASTMLPENGEVMMDRYAQDARFNWLLWGLLEEVVSAGPVLVQLAEPDDAGWQDAAYWMIETADEVGEFAVKIDLLTRVCACESSGGGRAESMATALMQMCREFAQRWSGLVVDERLPARVTAFNHDVLVLRGLSDLILCGIGDD
jgi:hypothetical protein